MRKKTDRTILLVIMAIVLVTVMVGYSIWNKPHINVKNANAIKTTAIALYSNLSKNDSIAKSNYVNKVVEVTGEITQVFFNQQHQQILLLKSNVSGGSVNCTMEEKITNIRAGELIVLKGICIGYIGGDMDMGLPGDVFLTRCYPSI